MWEKGWPPGLFCRPFVESSVSGKKKIIHHWNAGHCLQLAGHGTKLPIKEFDSPWRNQRTAIRPDCGLSLKYTMNDGFNIFYNPQHQCRANHLLIDFLQGRFSVLPDNNGKKTGEEMRCQAISVL